MPFIDPQMETANAAPNDTDESSGNQNAGQFAVYDGTFGPVAKIALVNAVLGLLTLGIYRFWGKTRMRQYLWSRITILGDRLEYTGTPKELLLGFLVAAGIMVLLSLAFFGLTILTGASSMAEPVQTVYFIAIYFLVFFAIYRARRYRLNRTQWRGIRFGQTGSARGYALRAMALLLLTGLSLGLCYPYMQTRLQEYQINNTWFGNRNLAFDGKAYDLFWKWVLALVLAIPTLYISVIWYKVVEFRYFVSRTRFGSLKFSSQLPTGKTIFISVIYGGCAVVLYSLLIGLVSAGALGGTVLETGELGNLDDGRVGVDFMSLPPLTMALVVMIGFIFMSLINSIFFMLFLHPMAKVVSKTLLAEGTIDLDAIKQSDQSRGDRGEGFADVLDVGAI